MSIFQQALTRHQAMMAQLGPLEAPLQRWIEVVTASLEQGGKVLWFGNGGSAADAQHMAAELVVRYVKTRRPLASIALTTDTSILTAHPNDFEFDTVFARQVEALARPEDVVVGLSTSGNSENVVRGLMAARKVGATTVGLTGAGPNRITETADIVLAVPERETARVQEAHAFLAHVLCEALDARFADR
ncbi:SIS domain-containing protein [Sulfurivirga sp.]|uniref:D-sedoheptulose-7-phosphate isomerase n=1 Tax=Sulfurivirga sp. TaxID=2614236 RepID=UPI0025F68626|nr:SIS domain-containing protein [Sulfurivirga sp.]